MHHCDSTFTLCGAAQFLPTCLLCLTCLTKCQTRILWKCYNQSQTYWERGRMRDGERELMSTPHPTPHPLALVYNGLIITAQRERDVDSWLKFCNTRKVSFFTSHSNWQVTNNTVTSQIIYRFFVIVSLYGTRITSHIFYVLADAANWFTCCQCIHYAINLK